MNPDGTEEDVFLTSRANKFVKHGIPPLETRTGIYPIPVSLDVKGPLRVDVRLRFRNLSPLIFDRLGLDESLKKRLVIIDMASTSRVIVVEENRTVNGKQQVVLLPYVDMRSIAKAPASSQEKIIGLVVSIDKEKGTITVTDAKVQKHVVKIEPKLLEGISVCNKVEIEVENGVAKSIKKL